MTDYNFEEGWFRTEDAMLYAGDYRGWFWYNMSDKARDYLNAVDNRTTTTLKCEVCGKRQSRGSFNLDHRDNTTRTTRRCNKCTLNRQVERGGIRWESSNLDWQEDAACATAPDPEIFHLPNVDLFWEEGAEWREYCPGCPVKDKCLKYGLDSKSDGIYGGKYIAQWQRNTTRRGIYEDGGTPRTDGRRGRPRKDA